MSDIELQDSPNVPETPESSAVESQVEDTTAVTEQTEDEAHQALVEKVDRMVHPDRYADDAGTESADSPEGEAEEKPKAVDIPNDHKYAAIAAGWTEDEINELKDLSPEKAASVFSKIYDQQVSNAKSDVAVGERLRQMNSEQEAARKREEGLAELKEKYGDSDAWEVIQDLYNKTGATPAPASSPKPVGQSEDDIRSAVVSFFDRDDIGPDSDYFGRKVNLGDLTPNQRTRRMDVIQYADNLLNVAAVRNEDLPISEALRRANLIVTADAMKSEVKRETTTNLKRREKTFTLPPTGPAKSKDASKMTDDEREARAADRLRERLNKLRS